MLALDTETTLILPGVKTPPLVCVSWCDGENAGVYHRTDPAARAIVERGLREGCCFCFAPFDLAVFASEWPDLVPLIFEALDAGRIEDVLIDEKLLDLFEGIFRFEEDEEGNVRSRGYSLAALGARYCGVTMEKDNWRLRYHELYDVPCKDWPEGAIHYARLDAVVTYEVWRLQKERGAWPAVEESGDRERQVRAAFALYLTGSWGMRTDPKAVETLENKASSRMEEITPKLIEAGLVRPDGTRCTTAAVRRMIEVSPDYLHPTESGLQVAKDNAWNFDEYKEHAYREGKWVKVNAEACLESGDEILMLYSEYSQLQSLLRGTLSDMKLGVRVPIQPRYDSLMATGRTSASGPNIQNIRRVPGVRECFVPREGNVFVASDYSAAELHTLGQTCRDLFGYSYLADALNQGRDVHLWVGSMLARTSYDAAVERLKAGDGEIAQCRQIAKAANFGFPGGCSAKTFTQFARGYGLNLTVQEATKIRKLWMSSWKEMEKYFEYVSNCEDDLHTGWYFSYVLRSRRLRRHCTYTSACNTMFQGLAADGAKASLYEVVKDMMTNESSPLYGCMTSAFIHDEIIVEVPEDRVHEAAMRLKELMETGFNAFVPDCPTEAEPAAMYRWSKKAKPVFDEHGRLIPWVPREAA